MFHHLRESDQEGKCRYGVLRKKTAVWAKKFQIGRGHALWLVALGKIDGILIPKCREHLELYVSTETEEVEVS